MKAREASKAREEWESKRTGISPLCGNNNNLDSLVSRGVIVRDIIATLDNGISIVGYRDNQNRLVGVYHDVISVNPDQMAGSSRE